MTDIKGKTNRLINIVMAVLMSVAMGLVASVVVFNTTDSMTTPFPIFCLLNVGQSVIVGILVAILIPFHKAGMYLTRNIKNSSLIYYLIFSIPNALGNAVIVSAAVSFMNIAAAYSKMDPTHAPPLFIMWFGSWIKTLPLSIVVGYVIAIIIAPFVIKAVGLGGPPEGAPGRPPVEK